MKSFSAILLTLVVAVPATWFVTRRFGGGGAAGEAASVPPGKRNISFYQSSMHPWVKSDKPGKCTICGMDLTAVREGEQGFGPPAEGIVGLSQTQIQVLGVQTTAVKTQPLVKTLKVAGQIDDDATRQRFLSAYLDGRVDRLYVQFVGAEVIEGQPLADLYSPTLLQAEREFRQLTGELQQRTALRLRQMGLTPAQIEALPRKDANTLTSQILSPSSGTVVRKLVFEGQYVREGEKLFELADFSMMWFVFQAYEQDLPWLEVGQVVDVTTPSRPGQTFSGRITFIDPNINEALRSTSIRVELPNPLVDGRRALLRRLYADGTVRVDSPPALSVPRSAIIQTGAEAVAYVDEGGGGYRRSTITTGRRGDALVEVLAGLKEGERVVTNGNLLIDGQAEINRSASPDPPDKPPPPKSSDPPLTQLQRKVISDFVQIADAMSAALSADDLAKFEEVSGRARETTVALVGEFQGRAEADALSTLSAASRFPEFADLASGREAFHPFSLAATAALNPLRSAAGAPGIAVFECNMVDQAIPGVAPKGRWLQAADRPAANPFFGKKMLDCATEIKP